MFSEEDVKIQGDNYNSLINVKNECSTSLDHELLNIKCEFDDEEETKIYYGGLENQFHEENIDKTSTDITKIHDGAFPASFLKTAPTISDTFSTDVKFEYVDIKSEIDEKNEELNISLDRELFIIKSEFKEEETKNQCDVFGDPLQEEEDLSQQSALNRNNVICTDLEVYKNEGCDNPCDKSKININSSEANFNLNAHGNLNNHLRIHEIEKQFKCETCNQYFMRKHNLKVHMRIHTGEKSFKCETCSQCFARKHNLIDHMRKHTGEKPFKCDMCSQCFVRKQSLKDHLRIHTGEKPFKCERCGKSFNVKTNLNYHLRNHPGEKPFKCETCGKSFKQKIDLITHLRIHTGDKPFKCEKCGRSFTRKMYLNNHLRIHTWEESL